LAVTWRRLHGRQVVAHHRGGLRAVREEADDGRPRPDLMPLIDAVAEPLLFEVGRGLSSDGGEASAPWTRCRGVLRVSPARGLLALDQEFRLLAGVAEAFARDRDAPPLLREHVAAALRASRRLACAELLARMGTRAAPRIRFGGVIVELYEPWFQRA